MTKKLISLNHYGYIMVKDVVKIYVKDIRVSSGYYSYVLEVEKIEPNIDNLAGYWVNYGDLIYWGEQGQRTLSEAIEMLRNDVSEILGVPKEDIDVIVTKHIDPFFGHSRLQ